MISSGNNLICAKTDVYGSHGEFSINLYYEVALINNELIPSNEIIQFDWFDIRELPNLKYKSTKETIIEYVQSPFNEK